MPHGVDGLPGDDHCHHGGLAGAGGQLQRRPQQRRVRLVVGVFQALQDAPFGLPEPRRDLGEPDHRFYRLDLAEERTVVAELVLPPVEQQTGRFRRDAPVAGRGYVAPLVNVPPYLVHGGGDVILLLCGGQPGAFVHDELALGLARPSALARLGDWRDELGAAAGRDDLLGRLALGVQFPMPRRILVRGVDDWLVKEAVFHDFPPPESYRK